MPPKTIRERASHKPGSAVHVRKNKTKQVVQGDTKPKPETPRVLANSIFALTLSPLKGFDIEHRKRENGAGDLLSGLQDILWQLAPAKPIDVPVDISLPEQITFIIGQIKSAVPIGVSFTLDSDEKRPYLTLVKECHYTDYFMPGATVGAPLLKLRKSHPALHNVFVKFLGVLIHSTKIETWYNGIFDHCTEQAEEMVRENLDEYDKDYVERIQKELNYYQTGDPAIYKKEFTKAKSYKPDDILRMLRGFKKNSRLVSVIRKGCDLIRDGFTMNSFEFEPYRLQQHGDYCLSFDCQAIILWAFNDLLNAEYDQWIESEANEGGVCSPVCVEILEPGRKKPFDYNAFKNKSKWPEKFAEFLIEMNNTLTRVK